MTISQPSNKSETQDLELIDEWPVDLEGYMEGLMVEVDEDKVLIAMEVPNAYEDGCFVFDIGKRSYQSEKWFQPDWVKQHWKVWHRGPEKGIRDLSVARSETRNMAAVATKANYAACWELGTEAGCIIEAQYGIQTVAVHPNTELLAIGTGRKVLDTVSPAIAEVQIWSTDGVEMLDKRRLPGACVINMLWVHGQDGLVWDYGLEIVDGRPIGKGRSCVVMESESLEVVLAVTTETRNQRGGFITLLNPQLLTILDIAEIPEGTGALRPICAWPEREKIWAGSFRSLNDLCETCNSQLDQRTAPQKTAAHMCNELWLSDGRMFKFCRDKFDAWVAQVWGRSK